MGRLRFLSKVEQVAAHLRGEMTRGKWHHLAPGRDELAAELGVNAKTVEHALKLLEQEGLLIGQGAGRRRRIAATEHDKTALKIGILLYDAQDHAQISNRELMHRLTAAGHIATIAEKSLVDLGMDPRRVAAYAGSIRTDAWIVTAGTSNILEWFARQPVPTLAEFGQSRDIPISSVSIDKIPPMREAVRKLISLGHRRIVLLTRPERIKPRLPLFESAFLDELTSHGIATGPYHLPVWASDIADFHRCLNSLFGKTPPTAMFIDEPFHFLATQLFLSRRGISVPRDVSMICLDPDLSFSWCDPMISHISWDPKPLATAVLKWANRVAAGNHGITHRVIPTRFVEGGTIGPAAKP